MGNNIFLFLTNSKQEKKTIEVCGDNNDRGGNTSKLNSV
jgi:hypothetical protein